MAAAVAGGALALLREQLNTQLKISDPSSALLRALLINGARSLTGNTAEQGFGILDLAGTALALQEGTFKIADENTELKQGETSEYKLQVTDTSMPVKITLAWVDPPGTPGASSDLVNNLDLIVQDPGGKSYYGNDFTDQGKADGLNNVEQVSIPVSKTGEYTIKVQASKIGQGEGQDFALVYGQTLQQQVIKNIDKNELLLLDGTKVNLEAIKLHQVVDEALVNSTANILVGSDIYLNSNTAYIFGRTWKTGGIQVLPTAQGTLIVEMNAGVQAGDYYLDPLAASSSGNILVNGQPVASSSDIPPGSELNATINPGLQTLWKLEASNQEINGFIAEVNPLSRDVKLMNNPRTYHLASWAAISYRNKILYCTPQDTPYGSAEQISLEKILPGTKVTLQVSPQTQVVQSLLLERPMVIGQVQSVNVGENEIVLGTGQTYQLFPGATVYRDKQELSPGAIQTGDWVMALLLPDSKTIIQMQAYSNVSYGRVVYSSSSQKSLYIIDSNNRSQTYTFDKQTEMFGWGIPLDSTAIISGSWVRIISDPTGKQAWRVDLAKIDKETVKTLASVNPGTKTLKMSDGSEYTYSSSTRISKGGYSINAEDIMQGEKVDLTTLLSPSPWPQVLVGVEANVGSDQKVPDLEIRAHALNGVLVIQGYSTADRLYLYRKDGSTERIIVTDGRVSRLYSLLENETDLRVVALDTRSGGMKVSDTSVNAYPTQPAVGSFTDTRGHWAEKYIKDLASRKIIAGYGDGSYHPDQLVSRAELLAMIVNKQDMTLVVMKEQSIFSDFSDIPWWALAAVLVAREQGLISGYPDGSFQPSRAITRSELAVIISHLSGTKLKQEVLPYKDIDSIPSWARDAFSQMQAMGILKVFSGENLEPNRPVTRAEVAAILDQI
jgi:hypothetical protein